MKAPIDFYFDFSSPYGYLASLQIEPLAAKHGRSVTWRPMLLGAAFKVSGVQPLVNVPLKGEYSKRDFLRSARFYSVPFRVPDEALYALARYIYSLEPPPNPHESDARIPAGRALFEKQGCAGCHTPPLYTNNKLTLAQGFTPPVTGVR